MMNLIRLFRRERGTGYPGAPRWIPLTGEPAGRGHATPGRGGRRKRRRAASVWREVGAWNPYSSAFESLRSSTQRWLHGGRS